MAKKIAKKTVKSVDKKKALPAKKKAPAKIVVKKAAAKKVVAKAAPAKKVAAPAKKPAVVAKGKKAVVAKPAVKSPAKPVGKVAVKPAPQPTPERLGKKKGAKAAPEAEAPEAVEVEAVEAVEEETAEEVVLTDAEGRRYCRVKDCDQLAAVDAYCRYHYLLYWKKIQVRKKILSEGKLERYIEELTARYPDKFLDMLRKDLRSEKEFLAAIQELEIDENAVDNEFEDETQNYIDEVRGMGEPTGTREDEDF